MGGLGWGEAEQAKEPQAPVCTREGTLDHQTLLLYQRPPGHRALWHNVTVGFKVPKFTPGHMHSLQDMEGRAQ